MAQRTVKRRTTSEWKSFEEKPLKEKPTHTPQAIATKPALSPTWAASSGLFCMNRPNEKKMHAKRKQPMDWMRGHAHNNATVNKQAWPSSSVFEPPAITLNVVVTLSVAVTLNVVVTLSGR